jgi:hypothetical protein
MNISAEVKKSLLLTYNNAASANNVLSGIEMYQDHVTSDVSFPFIVFKQISTNNFYTMSDTATGNNGKYINANFTFIVVNNQDNNEVSENVFSELENIYNLNDITMTTAVDIFGIYFKNTSTNFYDEGQKVWSYPSTIQIFAKGV